MILALLIVLLTPFILIGLIVVLFGTGFGTTALAVIGVLAVLALVGSFFA